MDKDINIGNENEEDLEWLNEPICSNCTSFFQDQDSDDWRTGFGVCMNDPEFDPFAEEICETGSFSCCYDLYQKKRFDGDREGCEDFELPEKADIPEGMDIKTYLELEGMKRADLSEVIKVLYEPDLDRIYRAISMLQTYAYMENEGAYEGLLQYYEGLGPAQTLEDVHLRKRIVEVFERFESERRVLEAFVNELKRSPSNNTTNQLYRLILVRLNKANHEIVSELLWKLLDEKKYSTKMKNKITAIAEGYDDDEYERGYFFL